MCSELWGLVCMDHRSTMIRITPTKNSWKTPPNLSSVMSMQAGLFLKVSLGQAVCVCKKKKKSLSLGGWGNALSRSLPRRVWIWGLSFPLGRLWTADAKALRALRAVPLKRGWSTPCYSVHDSYQCSLHALNTSGVSEHSGLQPSPAC